MSVSTSVCLSDVHMLTLTPSRDILIFSHRNIIVVDNFFSCSDLIMSHITATTTTPSATVVCSRAITITNIGVYCGRPTSTGSA